MKLSIKSNSEINELFLSNVKLRSEPITLCKIDEDLQALIPAILYLLISTTIVLLLSQQKLMIKN